MSKLIALKNKPDIKIITGVRRAGKSVLLNEFSKYILSVEKDDVNFIDDVNKKVTRYIPKIIKLCKVKNTSEVIYGNIHRVFYLFHQMI